MAKIYIDGKSYEVADGQNLLKACLGLGFDVPYFCWHPAMGSVGACRLCAVKQFKDENDTRGRIVMSCMTPATDGVRISISDPEARDFRKHVIEWLMINHPHDCPVCDEGGECHLQDMTLMTGHAYRRFRHKKRTFQNQYLGPLINHEMNRCIQCYRCVRFYRDFAGGDDLDVFGVHDRVYFGRSEDGVLQSEFSGNLCEVCPTGVFTDKTYKRHYTRKWDLQNAPSICHHCSLGCNIIASERYGSLRRVQSRYNNGVNGYFICDRGRFGYEHVNAPNRLRNATVQMGGESRETSARHAVEMARELIVKAKRVIGIGSPRASLEANYALKKMVGEANFYAGIPQAEMDLTREAIRLLKQGPARTPSLREIERHDAVLILGEDVTNTAPMMDLALRQAAKQLPRRYAEKLKIPDWDDYSVKYAIQGLSGPFFVANCIATKLDRIATGVFRGSPTEIARFGYAVADCIRHGSDGPREPDSMEEKVARDLLAARKPVVVSGTSLGSLEILRAAADVAASLHEKSVEASLSFAAVECNRLGLAMLADQGLDDHLYLCESDVLVVLENNLKTRFSHQWVEKILRSGCRMIAIDSYKHELLMKADVALPSGVFAECDGTLINNEGRAQRFYQVYAPENEVQESWRWICELAKADSSTPWKEWFNLDHVIASMIEDYAEFAPLAEVAPPAGYRIARQRIARKPHRFSGRTAVGANVTVHEPPPPVDVDSPLGFTMEGFQGMPPGALVPFFWSPGWNSQSAINKYQIEIGGPLHGGESGRRLIEPGTPGKSAEPESRMPEEEPRGDGFLLFPVHHIFGSEELSRMAPAIGELAPRASLFMNSEDAAALKIAEGQSVIVENEDVEVELIAVLRSDLPRGTAGFSAGYEETAGLSALTHVRIDGGGVR